MVGGRGGFCSVYSAQRSAEKTKRLDGSGAAQAVAVFAPYIGLEAVVGMLDGGDAQAACDQDRNQPLAQSGLPRAAVADDSERFHGRTVATALQPVKWSATERPLSGH
jgi:hypothetical protein